MDKGTTEKFGVIIVCCDSDLHYAKGCYASVRFYMPHTPVCFIYDGQQAPQELLSLPNATVLSKNEVRSEDLRKRSFGPGLTKMVSFFESPFETFLYLDSDTTICGDISQISDFENFDFIIDQSESYSKENVCRWFFDTDAIEEHFPDFDWESFKDRYFCTGVFLAKRGIFELSWYLKLLDFMEEKPEVFKFWEMGLLNYMIFASKGRSNTQICSLPYQLVTRDHPYEELRTRFHSSFDPQTRKPLPVDPCVFHYPVYKPHLLQKQSYTEPMAFFRRMFIREFGGNRFIGEMKLFSEDIPSYYIPQLKLRYKRSKRRFYQSAFAQKIIRPVYRLVRGRARQQESHS